MTPKLLALPGDEAFAERLARESGAAVVGADIRRFPDGESYLRLDDAVDGHPVAVVARLDRPDAKVPQLLFASELLRDQGAGSVGLVAPYLPYMRQDDRFRPGEAVTSATFAGWISAHFDWLLTVDPHLHRYPSLDAIYAIPACVVTAAPRIADWIDRHVESPVIIGPDSESEQWVRRVAEVRDLPWRVLEKTRHGDRDVEITGDHLESVRDRNPVIVDDICSSGATLAKAARVLAAAGFATARCVVVHGLFDDAARRLLVDAGVGEVVFTDSVQSEDAAIGLTGILAPALAERIGRRAG